MEFLVLVFTGFSIVTLTTTAIFYLVNNKGPRLIPVEPRLSEEDTGRGMYALKTEDGLWQLKLSYVSEAELIEGLNDRNRYSDQKQVVSYKKIL